MNYGDSLRDRLKPHRLAPKLLHEARALAAPLVAPRARIGRQQFVLWDKRHTYLSHPYNTTYRNERAVEIPVAADFLARQTGRGAEFGNVLSHYGLLDNRDVIDKYDEAQGVIRVDVLDYVPPRPLDFIVSVSTIEHVGWDEKPREPEKVGEALEHLLSLLAPGGKMSLTAPLGHNPHLDEAVMAERWATQRQATMVRVGDRRRNQWVVSPQLECRPYFGRGRGADALWVAEFLAA